MDHSKILGTVLAGGKSQRFGDDKSQVKLANKLLIDYILSEIIDEFKELLIISNTPIEFQKSEKFCFFAKALTSINDQGVIETIILEGQESFKLKPFREANSWAIIPEGKSKILTGEKIQIVPLLIGESLVS